MGLLDVVLGVLAVALLAAVVRVITGPTHADRALAFDFSFAVLVAAVGVLAVRFDTPALVHLIGAATLLGFLGTVALAALVERGPR